MVSSLPLIRCSPASPSNILVCRPLPRIICCGPFVVMQDARTARADGVGSRIPVPRHRHISVPKLELLKAIISTMFNADEEEEEARQFICVSESLESILHAEHKNSLEEMRADFDLTIPTKSNGVSLEILDNGPRIGEDSVTNQEMSGKVKKTSSKRNRIYKELDDEDDSEMLLPSNFPLSLRLFLTSSLEPLKKKPSNNPRVVIPGRLQRAFMQLFYNAGFEELSSRDLGLAAALNTDYLLTLPIYIDWKKASETSTIIFRRGYTTERQKGLLIGEKLDYLQSKLLQNFFLLTSEPLGGFIDWLNEVLESISKKQDMELLAKKLKLWLEGFSVLVNRQSYNEQMLNGLGELDIVSSDLPIWVAAKKAVTRYERTLTAVGPRERLFRKFLMWIGLIQSTPQQAVDLAPDSTTMSESHLRAVSKYNSIGMSFGKTIVGYFLFIPRVHVPKFRFQDITWKPASRNCCGNDFQKMLRTAFSIISSRSILQEPAFQELILLYTEEIGERDTADQADDVPLLQMKIYEKIPIPDLPVVFPQKKLSFRVLDMVRLDIATILGLLAYFISYKFEDILSSPSAVVLDAIAAGALLIYVSRVLLGYKQTRDRYQLLVNRALYEKTVASGFGCIHFLLDASEQQLYKEAILVYATLLKEEMSQGTSTSAIGDKCERFLYCVFQEKIEVQVDKAIKTLLRLGLVIDKVIDGHCVLQAMSCGRAIVILRDLWNSLIN